MAKRAKRIVIATFLLAWAASLVFAAWFIIHLPPFPIPRWGKEEFTESQVRGLAQGAFALEIPPNAVEVHGASSAIMVAFTFVKFSVRASDFDSVVLPSLDSLHLNVDEDQAMALSALGQEGQSVAWWRPASLMGPRCLSRRETFHSGKNDSIRTFKVCYGGEGEFVTIYMVRIDE